MHVATLNDQARQYEYIYGRKDPDRERHLKELYEKSNMYHLEQLKHCNQYILKRFCCVELCPCGDVYYKGKSKNLFELYVRYHNQLLLSETENYRRVWGFFEQFTASW